MYSSPFWSIIIHYTHTLLIIKSIPGKTKIIINTFLQTVILIHSDDNLLLYSSEIHLRIIEIVSIIHLSCSMNLKINYFNHSLLEKCEKKRSKILSLKLNLLFWLGMNLCLLIRSKNLNLFGKYLIFSSGLLFSPPLFQCVHISITN